MKLIKKGPGYSWEKKFTCTGAGNGGKGCGAILMVCHPDFFRTESGCYDGSSESYLTFECCQCNVWTDVDPKLVPVNLRELDTRYPDQRVPRTVFGTETPVDPETLLPEVAVRCTCDAGHICDGNRGHSVDGCPSCCPVHGTLED